jgi:hypothetical protein
VFTDVAGELGHEALAEAHDLIVGFALGIEVGASLATANRQVGQSVLEDLLEPEELDDPQIDGGVEAQTPLVGPERAVEFDPEAAVDLDLVVIVKPGHAKDDLPFRLADPTDDLVLGELRVALEYGSEAVEDLANRLVELQLPGVPRQHLPVDRLQPLVDFCVHPLFLAVSWIDLCPSQIDHCARIRAILRSFLGRVHPGG